MSAPTNIVPFTRRSYSARLFEVAASGLEFKTAGTLDGYIDFCITASDGSHLTYQFTRDDALRIVAALHGVVEDINQNCLFDDDPLLLPEDYSRE